MKKEYTVDLIQNTGELWILQNCPSYLYAVPIERVYKEDSIIHRRSLMEGHGELEMEWKS